MPANYREIIGQNLRALILEKGYRTVELFAHENSIDKGWLSRVIRGETDPSLGRAIKISEALGVTLDEIYPGRRRKKA